MTHMVSLCGMVVVSIATFSPQGFIRDGSSTLNDNKKKKMSFYLTGRKRPSSRSQPLTSFSRELKLGLTLAQYVALQAL
jgi:hypothetical protein